ncbi:hypothetical protein AK830_g3401 [Neonectria ditissima]|uniref:FAD-binding PCMH-type domain-containing protein n=1 Tax=Neonectria ditissima TaxID=78410 RepID=A0A0P7AZA9_9HYPO|nr:hypothetical protein AK830_g3401 [Neonectria ditissima]
MAASVKDVLPSTCSVVIPSQDSVLKEVLPRRWMQQTASSLPASVITPSTEEEIIEVLKYASANNLRVLPAGGGCAAYVVVNGKTIYLHMENFKNVHVDTERDLVTVGGGVRWSEVIGKVVEKGYYTAWTHFSSTGVVGSSFGGGLNSFIGTIGYSCDQIHSVRIITAKGEALNLSHDSTGQEKALFNMLRGGGMGLGVVTSLTLRLHKISSLDIEEGGKVVDYVAMFPSTAFEYAAVLYGKLTPISDERLSVGCVITNAPPGMPISGPVMMISANFIGTLAASQAPLAPLLSEETKSKALFVVPKTTELAKMNEQPDGRFQNGNADMDAYNSMLNHVPASTVLAVVQLWTQFNTESPALAAKSTLVMAGFSNAGPQAADPGQETGFCHRGRRFLGQVIWVGVTGEEIGLVKPFSEEVLAVFRNEDDAQGVPKAVFPNNMRVGTDMTQMYQPAAKMEALHHLKRYWDPENVFWNPAVNGWE